MHKLSALSILPGQALPWDVFDATGTLLLREGYIINQRQVDQLVERGLYRHAQSDEPEQPAEESEEVESAPSTFDLVETYKQYLKSIYKRTLEEEGFVVSNPLLSLCRDLQRLCAENADAVLAALHINLTQDSAHYCHAIHAAVLVELLAGKLGYSSEKRLPLLCAALTYDLGMSDLRHVENHKGKLTDGMWAAVKQHPRRSVEMLRARGVSDEIWLEAVLHHHERIDGSGYPDRLAGEQLSMPARLLAIADIFCALIRPRSYRGAFLMKDGLRTLFLERGKTIDENIAALLVKEVGIYPPGSVLKLTSGEIAIVTGRGESAANPAIHAFINSFGTPMITPQARECSLIQEMLPDFRYKSIWHRLREFFAID